MKSNPLNKDLPLNQKLTQQISQSLTHWFKQNARDLPWRKKYLPYEILISEMMLQQTQIKTALPFFQKWMAELPTLQSLADSELSKVMGLWQGLGYYQRAKNLHQLAKLVCNEFSGNLPNNQKELIKLPGIGSYSSGSIASIAFNQKTCAIDGNVRRVFARFYGFDEPINQKQSEVFFTNKANQLLEFAEPRIINQALMELGALVCLPKNPICQKPNSFCPLQNQCKAFKENLTAKLPKIEKQKINKTSVLFLYTQNHKAEIALFLNQEKKESEDKNKVTWWKNLYSLPYLCFSQHQSLNNLLAELNQNKDSAELIYQNKFAISNHKVIYYLVKVNQDFLNQNFSPFKVEYFSLNQALQKPISSKTKKMLELIDNL